MAATQFNFVKRSKLGNVHVPHEGSVSVSDDQNHLYRTKVASPKDVKLPENGDFHPYIFRFCWWHDTTAANTLIFAELSSQVLQAESYFLMY